MPVSLALAWHHPERTLGKGLHCGLAQLAVGGGLGRGQEHGSGCGWACLPGPSLPQASATWGEATPPLREAQRCWVELPVLISLDTPPLGGLGHMVLQAGYLRG